MIEFTTSIFMIASALTPLSSGQAAVADMASTSATSAIEKAQVSDVPGVNATIAETETYVRSYFRDTPILAEVARCESSFRQFDKNGDVIVGAVNRGDIGVMQINKYYHQDAATKLGDDIYTLQGNLAFAKWLYDKYGLAPWSSSSSCWKQTRELAVGLARI